MSAGAGAGHDPHTTARDFPMERLDNKVCLVTGAASGIGKRIAEVYAGHGARVAIADLRIEAAETVAQAIRDAGGDALAVAMDVTDERQVVDGVAKTIARYGRVDVLVSNAGIQIVNRVTDFSFRSEEHTSELQSQSNLVCRLLLE